MTKQAILVAIEQELGANWWDSTDQNERVQYV